MIKIKCPAKINLTLKVFKKDSITGFHPIESIMQTVNLYDYLTVELTNADKIEFSGNSKEISYDENNLVIKAANAFFEKTGIQKCGMKIFLEKNIPVAAGLAGGSTDAAGMVFALNKLFKEPLKEDEIFEINSSLGSDINFCYKGGCALCKGKGDEMTPLPFVEFPLSIIKPNSLKISTKDAYNAFDGLDTVSDMPNDLEFAMRKIYPELVYLHDSGFQMSGSGPSFFVKKAHVDVNIDNKKYKIFENLKSVNHGVSLA